MSAALDLFSISQTSVAQFDDASPENLPLRVRQRAYWCDYKAPVFAYRTEHAGAGDWGLSQGVCNHWDCKRCGPIIAGQHYGRMVEGARELAKKHELYFVTFTCRGREMTKREAEEGYLTWTNRLLTAMRTRQSRSGGAWFYAAVTERQKRGHPHTHMLTTYFPHDATWDESRWRWKTDSATGRKIREPNPQWRSDWFGNAVVRAGLGPQYDLSVVREPEAVSRYIAKYLFKDTALTRWPANWRRVRYSQNWPAPERESDWDCVALVTQDDWDAWAEGAVRASVPEDDAQLISYARHHIARTGRSTILAITRGEK